MPFSEGQKKRIAEVIQAKFKGNLICPLCHTREFSITDDLAAISIPTDPQKLQLLGGRILPCLALTCQNCGATQFLSVITLKIADLFGINIGTEAG